MLQRDLVIVDQLIDGTMTGPQLNTYVQNSDQLAIIVSLLDSFSIRKRLLDSTTAVNTLLYPVKVVDSIFDAPHIYSDFISKYLDLLVNSNQLIAKVIAYCTKLNHRSYITYQQLCTTSLQTTISQYPLAIRYRNLSNIALAKTIAFQAGQNAANFTDLDQLFANQTAVNANTGNSTAISTICSLDLTINKFFASSITVPTLDTKTTQLNQVLALSNGCTKYIAKKSGIDHTLYNNPSDLVNTGSNATTIASSSDAIITITKLLNNSFINTFIGNSLISQAISQNSTALTNIASMKQITPWEAWKTNDTIMTAVGTDSIASDALVKNISYNTHSPDVSIWGHIISSSSLISALANNSNALITLSLQNQNVWVWQIICKSVELSRALAYNNAAVHNIINESNDVNHWIARNFIDFAPARSIIMTMDNPYISDWFSSEYAQKYIIAGSNEILDIICSNQNMYNLAISIPSFARNLLGNYYFINNIIPNSPAGSSYVRNWFFNNQSTIQDGINNGWFRQMMFASDTVLNALTSSSNAVNAARNSIAYKIISWDEPSTTDANGNTIPASYNFSSLVSSDWKKALVIGLSRSEGGIVFGNATLTISTPRDGTSYSSSYTVSRNNSNASNASTVTTALPIIKPYSAISTRVGGKWYMGLLRVDSNYAS